MIISCEGYASFEWTGEVEVEFTLSPTCKIRFMLIMRESSVFGLRAGGTPNKSRSSIERSAPQSCDTGARRLEPGYQGLWAFHLQTGAESVIVQCRIAWTGSFVGLPPRRRISPTEFEPAENGFPIWFEAVCAAR